MFEVIAERVVGQVDELSPQETSDRQLFLTSPHLIEETLDVVLRRARNCAMVPTAVCKSCKVDRRRLAECAACAASAQFTTMMTSNAAMLEPAPCSHVLCSLYSRVDHASFLETLVGAVRRQMKFFTNAEVEFLGLVKQNLPRMHQLC